MSLIKTIKDSLNNIIYPATIASAVFVEKGDGTAETLDTKINTISNNLVNMTGATATSAGTAGFVIAPSAGDQNKFFRGDGTWGFCTDFIIDCLIILNNIPNKDDPSVNIKNITEFIIENQNTTKQVGFQGDGSGNFYVKVGSFGTGSSSDPNIKETGTLIYSASSTGNKTTNYQQAAHLANVMNYILNQTKGSSYGSNSALFPDTATDKQSSYERTELDSSTMSNGFYRAYGHDSNYDCSGRSYSGYYSHYDVYSNDTRAVWW